MSEHYYSVIGSWGGASEPPALIGAQFLQTLDKLSPVAPIMGHWLVCDPVTADAIPLAEARPNLTALVEKGVRTDDDGALDPDNGYRAFARGGEIEKEDATPRCVDIEANCGFLNMNDVQFEIGTGGHPPDLSLVTYPIYRGALEVLASTWPCAWAVARLFVPPPLDIVMDAIPDPNRPRARPPRESYIFPWILYLSADLTAGWSPPEELWCDRTPGGGMILSASLERLDPDDAEHLRRTRMLQAVIADRVETRALSLADDPGYPSPRVGPY